MPKAKNVVVSDDELELKNNITPVVSEKKEDIDGGYETDENIRRQMEVYEAMQEVKQRQEHIKKLKSAVLHDKPRPPPFELKSTKSKKPVVKPSKVKPPEPVISSDTEEPESEPEPVPVPEPQPVKKAKRQVPQSVLDNLKKGRELLAVKKKNQVIQKQELKVAKKKEKVDKKQKEQELLEEIVKPLKQSKNEILIKKAKALAKKKLKEQKLLELSMSDVSSDETELPKQNVRQIRRPPTPQPPIPETPRFIFY
jgi:hypothetical protein